MRKLVLRWLMPVALAFGIAGAAAAADGVDKAFARSFEDKVGDSFAKVVNFKLDGISNLVNVSVLSLGLEDLSVSIFDKKTDIEVYDSGSFGSSSGSHWSDTFTLSAGKYFLLLTGDISGNAAGYVGTLSAAPVPEPAEWMMMVAGVAMMGLVAARRRRV